MPQAVEDPVGRADGEDDHHPAQEGGADRGADRAVARAVEQVVAAAVAGEPPLERRPGEHHAEHDQREQRRRPRTGWGSACAPPIAGSKLGIRRSAPISQPMYQSGWAPFSDR